MKSKLPGSEASALMRCQNKKLLKENNWKTAWWVALDEGPAEENLGLIVQRKSVGEDADMDKPDAGFIRVKLKLDGVDEDSTDDSEAIARRKSTLYIFGSHYGSKDGPLEKERQWIVRFDESDAKGDDKKIKLKARAVRDHFRLHRVINDAFITHHVPLLPRGKKEERDVVHAACKNYRKKKWGWRIHPADRAINIEGAGFHPSGDLLLGLRFPVREDGKPLLVRVRDIDCLFKSKKALPEVAGFISVSNLGTDSSPRGIRGMSVDGHDLHIITGDLDSKRDKSVVLDDHPQGERADSQHHVVKMPAKLNGQSFRAKLVKDYKDLNAVEGIGLTVDGRNAAVVDKDGYISVMWY